MKPLSIGVIGLGAIGSRLVEFLRKEFSKEGQVNFLCDLSKERMLEIKKKWAPKAKIISWEELIDRADLVIEAASQKIAMPVAEKALRKNKQVLILSVGGLVPWNGLESTLLKTKGRLWIPSGALAGVDALLAANQGKIHHVTLTTRKPLVGLEGAPYLKKKNIRLNLIKEPTLIFEGDALRAIKAFPKNVNVAATLALAGVGPEKTRVRIFTSPTYRFNQHEVEIEGSFGRIRTTVENFPLPDNPKTSQLALLSAVAVIRKIFGHVHIGT